MKVLKTIAIIFTLLFFQVPAQVHASSNDKYKQSNWKTFKKTKEQSAVQIVQNKAALSLNKHDALRLITITQDELGFKHYRYQQAYRGIPVEGAVYLIHEKEGKATLSNGQLVHQLAIDIKPAIDKNKARKLAIQHIPAKLYAWESAVEEAQLKTFKQNLDSQFYPKGNLTIVDPRFSQNANNYRLAYKFKVFALEPFIQNDVYVDANNGDVLLVIDNIHSCTEMNINANTHYSGKVDVSVCADDSTSTLLKSSKYGGLEVRDSESNNLLSINDSIATEVLWATEKTFDYFSSYHNRNIADTITVSKINYTGNCLGAFYQSDDGVVLYCDGNGTTHNAYTTPDIVGHELTHGINKFSANLNIKYESGALNESFADIFGELVEAHCIGSADWITGAPVSIGNLGLRNLANPKDETMSTQQPHTYLGENWRLPSSLCIYANDYCGIHRNSGVQNYWFYLLAEGGNGINDNGFAYDILGIGKEKAAKIAYRNLTSYLTPSAGYRDARQGSIQAAIDFFGANSFEVQQTRKAWLAVGVNHNPIEIKTANEVFVSDASIQFELLADSLNQDISADGLSIYLDVQNHYNILSVELVHTDLQVNEITWNSTNPKEIWINRMNAEYIKTYEPLFKITAQVNTQNTQASSFEIKGGTTMPDGSFVSFENVLLNMPLQNCSNENNMFAQNYNPQNLQKSTQNIPNTRSTQNIPNTQSTQYTQSNQTPNTSNTLNWLPLITSISYESCSEAGSAIIKILEAKNAPYAHIWRDEQGTIEYQHVGYEEELEVSGLASGLYQVTVNDTGGNCTAFEVKIPLQTNRDGNNFCGNRCPDYLVTPDGNLRGTYNAKVELEVKGFVDASKNATFNICN